MNTLKKSAVGVVATLTTIVVVATALAADDRKQRGSKRVAPNCEMDRCTELYSYCDGLLSLGQSLCRDGADKAKDQAKKECLGDGGKEKACEKAAQSVWQAVWDACMDEVYPIFDKCIESVIKQGCYGRIA